ESSPFSRISSSKNSKIWYELAQGPVDSCRSDSSEYVLERGKTDGGEKIRGTQEEQHVEARVQTEGRSQEVDSEEGEQGAGEEGRTEKGPGGQSDRGPAAGPECRCAKQGRRRLPGDQGRGPGPRGPAQEEDDQAREEGGRRVPLHGNQGRREAPP